jgi:hypothetical protein
LALFITLKVADHDLVSLVNVEAIQQIRPLKKGRVRIFYQLATTGSDDQIRPDYDDFDIAFDEVVEVLRIAQVEVIGERP